MIDVAAPDVVQPANVPVSKPPLVMPPPPPAGFTVSVSVVLCVADVPVPVTVTVEVPVGVDPDVLIVSVEFDPELIGLGLNDAVAPVGRPLALSVTLCALPLTVVLTVLVPLEPCVAVALVALIVKSPTGAVTVSETLVLCVAEPSTPVTVTV
jgi:hypothetical protein